jgi:cytochrome P450 / NADPH-cytochrome P450 reductase
LLPNFSAQALLSYLPQMWDIAEQMLSKWERLNPNDEIDVSADMTRLTLDTIGLCGFNYRFNSFYREEPHPFIASMVRGLSEMMRRQARLPVQDALMVREHHQFQKDQALMNSVVDGLIKERRARGPDQAAVHDLLNSCLTGVDNRPAARAELAPVPTAVSQHNTPLLVLYGSNLGTAEGIAHRSDQRRRKAHD